VAKDDGYRLVWVDTDWTVEHVGFDTDKSQSNAIGTDRTNRLIGLPIDRLGPVATDCHLAHVTS
jgi:hypothetical protein